jgi:hypothetical protein
MLVISFWMIYNWHPLLDVSCHQFLDDMHVQVASIIGCFLSSVSVINIILAMRIQYQQ